MSCSGSECKLGNMPTQPALSRLKNKTALYPQHLQKAKDLHIKKESQDRESPPSLALLTLREDLRKISGLPL